MAIQTINYATKVTLNENTSVADVNKVKADDMNEIKSVVNNNANEFSNTLPVILYENETSPVATGTITLEDDISNYSKVDITFINDDNEVSGVTIYNPAGKKICLSSIHGGGTQYYYVSYAGYITLNGTTGTYSEGRTFTVSSNKTIFSVDATTQVKVTSIIGYK